MELYITVAPKNYNGRVKADFVCTGKNDELVIQQAIDKAVVENSNVMLLNGVYNIDSFNNYYNDKGPDTAVCFPNVWREIKVVGENHEYGFRKSFNNGVVLYVTESALESMVVYLIIP